MVFDWVENSCAHSIFSGIPVSGSEVSGSTIEPLATSDLGSVAVLISGSETGSIEVDGVSVSADSTA